eukprot:TRINITY_DN20824_c0_g1_i3.p1 TRINITY_DN20824_c0_g1~~TRINITY_DN20824_c0_g1_i3.p1  ORF type:complete len:678 (+),score=98.68 TRINITY_DN20824_c0_g1_i3:150-2183(+)
MLRSLVGSEMCIRDRFTQHHPLEGTVTAASALLRWGGPTSASVDHYNNCVIARAHRAVPQEFLSWSKNGDPNAAGLPNSVTLWEAIYTVRAAGQAGRVVPVAGSHHAVVSWAGVLSTHSRLSLDRWVANSRRPGGADSLITPGTSMVIRGTLSQIVSPHLSSSAAVTAVAKFHPVCASEFDPETAGVASQDLVDSVLAKWLLWARSPMRPLPPFATPYGPSVLYFYHNRTQGGQVTLMTQGFEWNLDTPGELESDSDRISRLTEHIRTVRAKLLHLEYSANPDGSFNPRTLNNPLHRHMRDEWAESAATVDPLSGQFISQTVSRIMAAGTGNTYEEYLEHNVAMLVPSMLQAGRLPGDQLEHVSLETRVAFELDGRTTDYLAAAQAPPAIWVPREDPELQARLLESKQASHQAVLDAAARVVRQQQQPNESKPVRARPVKKKMGQQLSRWLSMVLRHGALEVGLVMNPDGYVLVQDLLDILPENSVDDLVECVESNQKRRFQLCDKDGQLWIRATQGHSISTVRSELLMERVTDPAEVPVCLHGTYEESWELIRKSGLDRMGRNHIQMAVGLPNDPSVTSGVRPNIEVLIYIDVAQALEAGIPFYRSENNVICSPGPIPKQFFAHVVRCRDNESLIAPSWHTHGLGDCVGSTSRLIISETLNCASTQPLEAAAPAEQ